MGTRNGVEIRENSIRLSFTFETKSCRETLKTNGIPMAPTPANIKYANKMAVDLREKIKYGNFDYKEWFPDSASATTGVLQTVGSHLTSWLGMQSNLEASTIKGYRIAVSWWSSEIGHIALKSLKQSDVLKALATKPKWTGKTRNNKVGVLRPAMVLALRDGLMSHNPLAGMASSPHQKKKPDPFSQDEAEAIIIDMRENYGPQIANYFEFKFFTGLRTSESLGLRWDSIDWRMGQMLVTEGIVMGLHKETTKTNSSRLVNLNSRALEALKRQKEFTQVAGQWVFLDPKTNARWVDDWTPREMYWRRSLKRLGMRYRSPYQTRHTYATMMLMAGLQPAYSARQMGHDVAVFLSTYAKWLDGKQDKSEQDKLEKALSSNSSPELPQPS